MYRSHSDRRAVRIRTDRRRRSAESGCREVVFRESASPPPAAALRASVIPAARPPAGACTRRPRRLGPGARRRSAQPGPGPGQLTVGRPGAAVNTVATATACTLVSADARRSVCVRFRVFLRACARAQPACACVRVCARQRGRRRQGAPLLIVVRRPPPPSPPPPPPPPPLLSTSSSPPPPLVPTTKMDTLSRHYRANTYGPLPRHRRFRPRLHPAHISVAAVSRRRR